MGWWEGTDTNDICICYTNHIVAAAFLSGLMITCFSKNETHFCNVTSPKMADFGESDD